MASYEIQWKSSALKDLRSINAQFIPRIIQAVDSLAYNPLPLKSRKLHSVESTYRIRIGNYRVIYQVDAEGKLVVIYHVRHRKDVYRNIT